MDHADISKNRHVEICREGNCSSLREIFEPAGQGILSISLRVIVGAVRFFTSISVQALLYFEVFRMELLLFPAMAIWTSVLILTAILIGGNEAFRVPVLTHIL